MMAKGYFISNFYETLSNKIISEIISSQMGD